MSGSVYVYRLRGRMDRTMEDTMTITTLRAAGRPVLGDTRLSRREVLAVSGVLAGLAIYLTTLMLVVV